MAITLNDVSARNDYVATAGQTVFPLTFKFFANSDLLVYQNGVLKTLVTHYTVAGANVDVGMAITLVTGAALNDAIAIVRAVPYERTTQLPVTGPFPIAALNTFLSKLTAMVQQIRDKAINGIALDVASATYYDAQSKRIANIAAPVSANDAVNKTYVDSLPAAVAAAASATAAATSATSAANALASTLAAYDSFDDRYLGSFASAPTLDNDGAGLVAGTLYYKTGTGAGMYVYTGSAWVAAYIDGSTALLKSNNLSDLANTATARTNLGLAMVAQTGAYNDLTGKPLTGKIVNRVYAEVTTPASVTSIIPGDDTIPQVSEGTQIASITVITTTATQRIRLRFGGSSLGSVAIASVLAWFRDGAVNAIAASMHFSSSVPGIPLTSEFEDAPGAAGTYVYTVRFGPISAATLYLLNGAASTRWLGGVWRNTLVAEVIEP